MTRVDATCRGCGCTDSRACAGGCMWVELDRAARVGLCSTCYAKEPVREDTDAATKLGVQWLKDQAAALLKSARAVERAYSAERMLTMCTTVGGAYRRAAACLLEEAASLERSGSRSPATGR